MMEEIIKAVRKARSVLSIHLSNNPFLIEADQELIDEIIQRIHAKPAPAEIVEGRPDKIVNLPEDYRERIQLKEIQAKKEMYDYHLHVADAFWNNELILQRKLGHKIDILGLGQWEVASDLRKHALTDSPGRKNPQIPSDSGTKGSCGCWICSRERYTLIFWSQSIQNHVRNER